MAELECVRVYYRASTTQSHNSILYDKDSGTGSDNGRFGYLYANSNNINFYLRIYKLTTTGAGTYRFQIKLPGAVTQYSPSDILSKSVRIYCGVKSSKDDYIDVTQDTISGYNFFTAYPSTSGGVGGDIPLTIPSAGTWYIGVWVKITARYTGAFNLIWTGLSGKTATVAAKADYVSSTSMPMEGGPFSVTIKYLDTILPWRYEITKNGSTIYTSSTYSTVTSNSITVQSSWFGSESSITCGVNIYTQINGSWYWGSSATVTFYTSGAFAPTIAAGAFSSVTPVNTGSLDAYFATLSRVRAVIDTSYITCQAGSSLYSVSVTLDGVAMSSSGYTFTSNIIANAGTRTLTLSATDTAGRTSTRDYTITALAYTKPSLTDVAAYRCDGSGTASETGLYFRAKAKQQFMAITVGSTSNAGITHIYLSENGSTYVEQANLPDNVETQYSGLNAANTYTLRFVITDLAGGSSDGYIVELSYEEWMFCCTSNGGGAAIGMGASTDDALEIPNDWVFKSGAAEFGQSIVKLVSGAHYGTANPSGVGEDGELYFKLSSSSTGWISCTPYIYKSS